MNNRTILQNRHNYRVFLLVCLCLVIINLPLSLITNNNYSDQLIKLNFEKTSNIIYFFYKTTQLDNNTNERILSALNNEKLHLDFSNKPKYQQTVLIPACKQTCRGTINGQLKKINFSDPSPPVNFSVFISPIKQWLNFSFEKLQYPLLSIFSAVLQLAVLFVIFTYLISMQRFVHAWRKIMLMSNKVGITLSRKHTPFFGPTIISESITLMEIMVQRIDKLIQERVATIAALSHDIRTPLTRMKFYSDKITEPNLKTAVGKQINEIQYFLEETLSYSRQDYQDEPKKRVDLISLLEAICTDMQDVHQDVLFFSTVKQYVITGQRIGLKRAMSNLIENGIKYGKAVIVKINHTKHGIKIEIIDKGTGLPEEALAQVLEPFGRYTKNHDKKIQGTGLGLTIAKTIIESNQGKLILGNDKQLGLNVTLLF
jgi:signal transduction histidine kinase